MHLGTIRRYVWAIDETFAFRGHTHPRDWELLVGMQGCIGLQLGQANYHLHPGELILIQPGIPHMVWDAATGPHPARALYYNAHFEAELPPLERLACLGPIWLRPGIKRYWRGWRPGALPAPPRCDPELWFMQQTLALLSAVATSVKTPRHPPAKAPGMPPELHIERRLAELIQREPGRLHRRAALARYFLLAPNYLSAKVRLLCGKSLMQTYYRLKLQHTVYELRLGRSVGETARLHGFANPFHYSRKFKQVLGQSPVAFKAQGAQALPPPLGRPRRQARGLTSLLTSRPGAPYTSAMVRYGKVLSPQARVPPRP